MQLAVEEGHLRCWASWGLHFRMGGGHDEDQLYILIVLAVKMVEIIVGWVCSYVDHYTLASSVHSLVLSAAVRWPHHHDQNHLHARTINMYRLITRHDPLPCENANFKKLNISGDLLQPLAALIVNITSLTYLEIGVVLLDSDLPVLTNIVQSHCTLEVLEIVLISEQLATDLIKAVNNSRLKKLRFLKLIYDNLPPHIHEQYKHLLEPFWFE